MFIGISVGANVVLGKFIGARDEVNTSKAVHTAIFIAIFGGLLMVFVGFFCETLARVNGYTRRCN